MKIYYIKIYIIDNIYNIINDNIIHNVLNSQNYLEKFVEKRIIQIS